MSVDVFHAVTNESFCYIDTNLNKHNAWLIIEHFKLERSTTPSRDAQQRPSAYKYSNANSNRKGYATA